MPDHTSLSPMLSVRRGADAVDFYRRAFDATTLFRIDDPAGGVVAQLSVGGAQFWVADESPAHQNFSPESLRGTTVRMILVVDFPAVAVARALSAGATLVADVDERDGWLIGRIVDPFGHHWEIGKPLVDQI